MPSSRPRGCRRRGLPGARAELVADEHRIDLARRLTDIVHAADERLLPGASPVDRAAVRASRPQLLEVAAPRLRYRPAGDRRAVVLLVERLLDGGSRSSGTGRTERLRVELAAAATRSGARSDDSV